MRWRKASGRASPHSARRRLAGEPVAYLVGEKEFHGLDLQVDARVLVPRPDTETLVDWALQCLEGRATPSVLDLGTGSGAIALAHRSMPAPMHRSTRSRRQRRCAGRRARQRGAARPGRALRAGRLAGRRRRQPRPDRFEPALRRRRRPAPAGPAPRAARPRWCRARTAWTTSGASSRPHRSICATAAGCCSSTATTRPPRVRELLAARGFAEVQSRDDLAGIAALLRRDLAQR